MTTEITSQTRVGMLLADARLEQALLDYHPAFGKLKNPILRRTVARIATLKQAAEVAGVDVGELVAALRRAVGMTPLAVANTPAIAAADAPAPAWIAQGEVVTCIDADQWLERGEHPLAAVQRLARALVGEQRIEIVASFKPVPLIDTLAAQGLRVASDLDPQGRHRVHVGASAAPASTR